MELNKSIQKNFIKSLNFSEKNQINNKKANKWTDPCSQKEPKKIIIEPVR